MRFPGARIMHSIRPCRKQILIWYCIRKRAFAAEDFHDRLKIPYIELRRLYQIDKIASQYRAFAAALGVEFEDEIPRKAERRR